MSTPRFNHFFCPHCAKRFANDDSHFVGAELHRALDAAMGVGGVLATLNESVPCPNPKCGKGIPLDGIFSGRFDSPKMTLTGCVLTIVYFIVAIVVFQLLAALVKKLH